MQNEIIINHKIQKSAEGTYYTLPFEVPDGLESFSVSYTYIRFSGGRGKPSDKINIVDLGIIDNNGRFIGWSGSVRRSVTVGPFTSTNGYLMTHITPGEWQIIIGAYKIPDEGLPVRYEIEFLSKGNYARKASEPDENEAESLASTYRWFIGDTHMHSDASDGQHDIATLAKMAKRAKLDFIAVSNHNNYTDNLYLPRLPGLTLLPAVEWTHYKGHFNFYGVAAPFENSFIANSEDEALFLISAAREMGAVVAVNHPKCTICPYLWQSEDCFDMVEVWNGPMRKANMNAIAWWHSLLMRGKRIPIVGGSDFHKNIHPVRFAHPVLNVYARSPATDDIIKAMASGNSFISASPNGVKLDLRCESAMMGDESVWFDGMELSVTAESLRPGMRLKLATSEGVFAVSLRGKSHESDTNKSGCGKKQASVRVPREWKFVYLVAYRKIFGFEYVCAITNPLYFQHKV